MAPENAASVRCERAELTPENAELLAEYAVHLERAPLSGHTPRTYLGAVRAYLSWLQAAGIDGSPLADAAARDWAVRDYRSYLVTVAKRAAPTVNKHLAALQDFYAWRGLGQPLGVKRHQVPRHAPRALGPRAKLRYLRAVEAWPSARDRAIALLPLYAGTRIAEVAALDTGDIRLSARKGELHLVGKGEKSRIGERRPRLQARRENQRLLAHPGHPAPPLRIRSYLTTARSHGRHPLAAIRDALTGDAWMPPHPSMIN